MDRVAQLAEAAGNFVAIERYSFAQTPDEVRAVTRKGLADYARSLGFPESEISAAIDTALGGR